MDYIHCSNYEAQQLYFALCRGQGQGLGPTAPTFSEIINSITLNLCSRFNHLPSSWYIQAVLPVAGPSEVSTPATPAAASRSPRQAAGLVTMVNQHADHTILARLRGSGHGAISQMMEGHTCTVPKLNGQEVCLA